MIRYLLLSVLCVIVVTTTSSTALASGLDTSTATGAGQVRVTQDGNAFYLTTDTNPDPNATLSARTQNSADENRLFNFFVDADRLPEGFFTDIDALLTDFINIAFIISILLAFFYLIWAGFDWITSGGDKGKIEGARSKIMNAVIGIIVVAASYAVLTLALNLLGYDSLDAVFREYNEQIDRN